VAIAFDVWRAVAVEDLMLARSQLMSLVFAFDFEILVPLLETSRFT
jgi:hypothetical protein